MTAGGDFGVRLRAAFPARPLEFQQALTGGTDEGEFRNAVNGKPWTDLDPSLIGRRSDVLSFLQPEYFVAVLPAFLRSLVEDGTATGVPDTLLVVLDRRSDPRLEKIAALNIVGDVATRATSEAWGARRGEGAQGRQAGDKN